MITKNTGILESNRQPLKKICKMSTQYDHTGEFKILYLKALWPFTLTGSSIVLQDFFPKAFFQHFSIFNILSAPRKASSYVFLLVPLLSFGSACKVFGHTFTPTKHFSLDSVSRDEKQEQKTRTQDFTQNSNEF